MDSSSLGDPLLTMSGMTKRFPGVVALSDVSLAVGHGEVHALLGENGAGKSTLLKILAGAQSPDGGTIVLADRTTVFASPSAAQAAGIVTIYQEFNLVPSLTIAENIFIGREPTNRLGLVDWRAMVERTRALVEEVGLTLDPRRLVSDLSVAEQQLVEIARALSMEARLVVMDEPTSALSGSEVERLFAIIRALKAKGISIVFVTHRLDEVMAICDRFTVLRDGGLVAAGDIAEVRIEDLVRMMVGRDVERLFRHRARAEVGEAVLQIKRLRRLTEIGDARFAVSAGIDLEVRRGEILGLAGLVGAGRTELARALFGADPIASGEILIDGRPIQLRSPLDAIRAGIGLVPEDRKQQALFLALAVRENLSIAALDSITGRFGLVDRAAERSLIATYRERLGIKMASPEQAIASLSGGNQQKVVLARWLALQPKLLIVDEPTRGIDVAAKAEVHQVLYELADAGIAIIAISSELPEVMTVSDRILTMREGRITGEVKGSEASEERLMQLMTFRTQNHAA